MDKFISRKDGAVFYAKKGTIQHSVFANHADYELGEVEELEELEELEEVEEVENKKKNTGQKVGK